MKIDTIWRYRDAEYFAAHATNEYGELDPSMIQQLSDAAWWSGVGWLRYGPGPAPAGRNPRV